MKNRFTESEIWALGIKLCKWPNWYLNPGCQRWLQWGCSQPPSPPPHFDKPSYSTVTWFPISQISSSMMGSSEKLCLQWNDFKENMAISFRELRKDREFTDVTLACEDGRQIEAHKVILASFSPFFMELLKKNKHPHPLVYMRGLMSEDLVAIVDFCI